MLILGLGGVLVAGGSFLLACALRVRGAALLLATGALGAAQVVALAMMATPFDALGRAWWLVGHALVAVGAVVIWAAAGRPLPTSDWRAGVAQLRRGAAAQPAVAVVLVVAFGAALLQLIVAMTTAPANWDSMTYHLSRAAYWLQEGSIGYFADGSLRQLANPPNGEIGLAWTMALAGNDSFVALVGWLAFVAAAVAIYVVARVLRFPRHGAAFAAAVWMLLPGPLMQAATTQNDIVVTCAILATVAFGLRALSGRARADIALAGLAFGLGIGAKGSFLFAVPPLALLLGAAIREFRPSRRLVVSVMASAATGALLLGSFGYFANIKATGGPFGGLQEVQERKEPAGTNAIRVAWSFVEAPGLGASWVQPALDRTVGKLGVGITSESFYFTLDTSVDEDRIVAGVVGLLVLFPLAVFVAVGRGSRPVLRGLALGALLYVLLFGLLHVATPFNGRVLMPAYSLAAPLVAIVAWRPALRGAIGLLCVLSALPVLLTGAPKTVLTAPGGKNVWQKSRAEQMAAQRAEYLLPIQFVEHSFPAGSRLLFIGGEDAWDYPLFGEARERHVMRINPGGLADLDPQAFCHAIGRLVEDKQADGVFIADVLIDHTEALEPEKPGPTVRVAEAPRRGTAPPCSSTR